MKNEKESIYLEDREVIEYLIRYRNGEKEVFDILYSNYTSLIHNIINHYFKRVPISHHDLFAIGEHGLFKAMYYFNEKRGIKFSTYAYRCVYNEIAGFIREEMGTFLSLNEPIYRENRDSQTFLEELSYDKLDIISNYEKQEEYQVLYEIIDQLPKREKTIVLLFYGLGGNSSLSLSAIGKKLNLSRTYVTSCLKQAEKRIKEQLRVNGYNYHDKNKINEEELLLLYQDRLSTLSLIDKRIIVMYLEGYTILEIAIQVEKNTRYVTDKLDKLSTFLKEHKQEEIVFQLQMRRKKRKGKK